MLQVLTPVLNYFGTSARQCKLCYDTASEPFPVMVHRKHVSVDSFCRSQCSKLNMFLWPEVTVPEAQVVPGPTHPAA